MALVLSYSEIWSFEVMLNPAWKWVALLVVLLAGFVVGKVISFLMERQARRLKDSQKAALMQVLLASVSRPVQMGVFAGALYFGQTFLVLDVDRAEPIRTFWVQVANAMVAFAVAWGIFRLVDVLEHVLEKLTSRTETMLDDQLVPLVRKTLRVFIVIIATLFIAQNIFAWNVGSLIAGLGIGGLAFALAAKDSIANLFGSAVIFADRPFAMGDRIRIQGYDGVVEEVGFRSTKIRTLIGHKVTIPNSVVATDAVENVSARRSIKRVLNVGVTYDTPAEKLQLAVDILRDMLNARTDYFAADNPPRVFFSDFNADNLNIIVYYWFVPAQWWEYLKFNHEFNMELLRRFNEEKIEFAFPTQTLHLRQEGQWSVASDGGGGQGST